MKQLILAAILGGLVLFGWHAVSWMVLPFHEASLRPIPDGDPVLGDLRARLKEPGVYHYPGTPAAEATSRGGPIDSEAWKRKWLRGPVIPLLVYVPTGSDPMRPAPYVAGLGLFLAMALVAAWLLQRAAPTLPDYASRVAFVVAIGLLVAIAGPLSDANWFTFPADFVAIELADAVVGWTLAGLVLAWRIRPVAPWS